LFSSNSLNKCGLHTQAEKRCGHHCHSLANKAVLRLATSRLVAGGQTRRPVPRQVDNSFAHILRLFFTPKHTKTGLDLRDKYHAPPPKVDRHVLFERAFFEKIVFFSKHVIEGYVKNNSVFFSKVVFSMPGCLERNFSTMGLMPHYLGFQSGNYFYSSAILLCECTLPKLSDKKIVCDFLYFLKKGGMKPNVYGKLRSKWSTPNASQERFQLR